MLFYKKIILLVLITLCVNLKAQTVVGVISSTQPDSVCEGTTGLMTLNGVIYPVIRWEISTDGGATWPTPINDTTATHSYFQIPNSTCYRVVHNGGASVSSPYCITVDEASNAGTITGGGEQCGVANGTMIVTSGVGTPLGWYWSTGSTYTSLSNTTTSQSYSVTGTTYYAYVVKNGVCPADTARDTISIVPYSAVGNPTTLTPSVCAISNTVTVSVQNSSITGSIIAWEAATSLSGPWDSVGAASSYSTTNITVPTYYHLIVKSGICPPDTSDNILINVEQAPIAGTLSGSTNHCGALPATGTINLSGQSGTVTWEVSTNGSPFTTGPCSGTSCNYTLNAYGITVYHVKVENGSCPPAFSANDTIKVSQSSDAGILTDNKDTICAYSPGGVLTLTNYTASEFHWEISNNGTAWTPLPMFTSAFASYLNLPPGTLYFHCVVNNNFCSPAVSNSVTIVVTPSPTVSIITNDTIIDQGATIPVVATGSGNPSWSPASDCSNPNSFTTEITAFLPTDYVITVSDATGCTGTDTLHVDMTLKAFSGFISNSLTPNGDGINDEFYVENILAYKTSSVKIFNEYGQLIYSASPYVNDWKGTYNNARVPDGTYYYVLTLLDIDKQKEFKGFISILGGK